MTVFYLRFYGFLLYDTVQENFNCYLTKNFLSLIIDFLFSNILKYGHWLYRPRHQYFDHCEIILNFKFLMRWNNFFVIWIFRCQFKTWKLILKCQERKKLEEWLGVIKGRPSHLPSGWGVSRRPLFPQPHQPAVVGLLAVQIAAQFSTAVLRFRFVKS